MKAVLQYRASPGLQQRIAALDFSTVVVDETDKDTFLREMRDAEVLLHVLQPVTAAVIDAAPRLRLIQKIGFETYFIGGFPAVGARYGVPDVGLMGFGEISAAVRDIMGACDLPVFVDGDDGYGDVKNVVHTVQTYERMGVSAILIEDQQWPKRCGHMENKEIVPLEEGAAKIKAAVGARSSRDFQIIARTDARSVVGLDEALRRADAYLNAGADLLFVEAPQSVDEMKRITKEVPGNHICNIVFGGKTPMLPREELAAIGFSGILYANAALQSAMLAMKKVLTHLKDKGSLAGTEADVLSFADRQTFVDYDKYKAIENKYK